MSLRILIPFLYLYLLPFFLSAQRTPSPYTDMYTIKEDNGLTLSIRRIGYERNHVQVRTILLVHGGDPGAVASFDFGRGSFAELLAGKGFIVYIMDIRGWGESTAPAYDLHDTALVAGSCAEAAEDIDAVVDHIRKREQIDRVNLFGWATGGHWSAYYTTHHNDKVSHLIVLNTLYGVNAPWSLSSGWADPSDSNRYNPRIPLYRVSDQKSIIASRLASIPFPDKTPWVDTAQLDEYAWSVANDSDHQFLRVPGGYRRESFYMAHGHQYWNAHDIHVPTLIVRSQHDFWSRPIDVATFYNDLPTAPRREAIELPNATHYVTIDKPRQGADSLIAAIDRFIPLPTPAPISIIDSLQTDEQALSFVRKFDGTYADLYLNPPKPPFAAPKNEGLWRRQFGAQQWAKGDFDGNGKTDLLFNGYNYYNLNHYSNPMSVVVLNLGQDSFRVIPLTLEHFIHFFAVKKITIDHQDYIVTYQLKRSYGNHGPVETLPKKVDTLIYKCDHFIERTQRPGKYTISELQFSIGGGMGNDPGFNMVIRNDSVTLREDDPMGPDSNHVFIARLDTATSHKLYALLHYINIPTLRSHYSVDWTDDYTGFLQVIYSSGKIKRIDDYGKIGTYGLAALYDLLENLRYTLDPHPPVL